jgi:CheY-like chemotaxis protein
MHALVIEDDAITAMMIGDELSHLGYSSVDTATTRAEAMRSVEAKCPDLVTSEDWLGLEAVRKIRASLSVPVIFITCDPEHARHSIPDAPVLEKPFSILQLVAAVEQARLHLPAPR